MISKSTEPTIQISWGLSAACTLLQVQSLLLSDAPWGHLKSACSHAILLALVKPWGRVSEAITFIPVTGSGSFPPQIYLEAAPSRSRQTSCLDHQGPHSRPLPSGGVPASYRQMASLATFFFF